MKKLSKKKKIIMIVSICLAVVLICSTILTVVLLRKKGKEKDVSGNDGEILATDIDLVRNGQTEYTIVIPEEANGYEEYAAEELALYLHEATSAEFLIVQDTNLTFNKDDKVLSVGETSIKNDSGVEVDYAEFGRDGFRIVRKGNTVVLCGGGGYGTLYAVYEFLYRQIDWEAYAPDEIYYKKTVNSKVLDYNFSDKPAIENRYGGWYAGKDAVFSAKRRTLGGADTTLFDGHLWFFYPHATFKLVSPIEHYAEHPDWFAASKQQICYSSKGCQEAVIEAMKKVFLEQPNIVYIPVGLEDNYAICGCEQCKESIAKYKFSGMLVRWTNEVNEAIQKWRVEEGIERELYIPLLAYYQVRQPPIETALDGSIQPIDESCVLAENCPVIYAPLEADHDFPWEHPENAAVMNDLNGWLACSKKIAIYHYNNDVFHSFEWLDTMALTVKNYKLAAEIGAMYLTEDATNKVLQSCAFEMMLGYVYSKVQWNPDVDTNTLVRNFIAHYYKEAKEEVLEYYYLMKMNYQIVRDEALATGVKEIKDTDWLSKGLLEQAQVFLRKGIEDISNNANYTKEEKLKYLSRVELELLTPLVYVLDYLSNEYTKQSYYAIIDEVEALVNKYGIANITADFDYCKTNEEKYAEWRANKQ